MREEERELELKRREEEREQKFKRHSLDNIQNWTREVYAVFIELPVPKMLGQREINLKRLAPLRALNNW